MRLLVLPIVLASVHCAPPASRTEPPAPLAVDSQPSLPPPRTERPVVAPDDGSPLAPDDRIRLAEAFRLAESMGDALWPGWSAAPFALLLVTDDREFLLRHPRPPVDFTQAGFDSLLRSDVLVRPRVLSPNLLATFPIAGVPTVVIGSPRTTGKASTAWVLTVLHEHFHQLQMSRPSYFAGVDALELSRGDQTGMWMLNFPFPYDSSAIGSAFGRMAQGLDSALSATSSENRRKHWRLATDELSRLRGMLSADDHRYLAFQMWQEGVARYTELRVARWAASNFTPAESFRALPDASSYAAAADSIQAGIRAGLRADPLRRSRRVAFYPAGAAMALLLDEFAPGWQARYPGSGYSLEPLIVQSRSTPESRR